MNGFGLLPQHLYTTHVNAGNTRGPSPRLWARAVETSMPPDGTGGFCFFDDFLTTQGVDAALTTAAIDTPTAVVASLGTYGCYLDIGSDISRVETTGGVLRFNVVDDNDAAIINTGPLGAISDTAADAKLTIFEARVRYHTQVTAGGSFLGLGNSVIRQDSGFVDNTAEIDAAGGDNFNGIGFRTLHADPDGVDFVVQDAAATATVIADAAKVVTADTWYKFGFMYDPDRPVDQKISIWIDNVEQSTYVTATQIAAATFPDADPLGLVAGAHCDAGTDGGIDLDWWGFYQAF